MGLIPEKIERLIFPGFLFIFEVLMLILFGALVRYAPLGTPLPVNVTAEEFRDGDPLDPVAHVEQTYPRKLCCMRTSPFRLKDAICKKFKVLAAVLYTAAA